MSSIYYSSILTIAFSGGAQGASAPSLAHVSGADVSKYVYLIDIHTTVFL